MVSSLSVPKGTKVPKLGRWRRLLCILRSAQTGLLCKNIGGPYAESSLATMGHHTNVTMTVVNHTGMFLEPRVAKNNIKIVRKVNCNVANGLLIALDGNGYIHYPQGRERYSVC